MDMTLKTEAKQPFYKSLTMPLRLDLQYFADGGDGGDNGNNNPSTGQQSQQSGGQPDNGQQGGQGNAQGFQITLDAVQKFVSENEEGKKWLQSLTDSRVTEAIKTYEKKTLPKKVEEEINKRFPPETEEQKQLRELKQKLEQIEQEKIRESLRNKALSVATEKQLPTKLVDFFIGQDEETTMKNLSVLEEVFSAAVQQAVEARFKDGGRNPKPSNPDDQPLTKEMIEKMTPEEINANWERIEKFLQGK
jgi:acetylornithine deacetylase/succinyl-diaminopimelate desuccinylase-like protein